MVIQLLAADGDSGQGFESHVWYYGLFVALVVGVIVRRTGWIKPVDDPEAPGDDRGCWIWFAGIPFGGVLLPLAGVLRHRHDATARPLLVEYRKGLVVFQLMFMALAAGFVAYWALNDASPLLSIMMVPMAILCEVWLWRRYRLRLPVRDFWVGSRSCQTAGNDRTSNAVTADVAPVGGLRPDQLRWLMGGLMVGLFLSSTEQSVVATALPTMAGELGGANRIAWVVSAYLLTSTIATPLYGKMSDLFGRRIVYQTSISIFLVGSALCALSQTMTQLVLARAVPGPWRRRTDVLAFVIVGDVVSP
ncbi:MAG: MFS transporter [Acidimicrobiales bacterium]